MLTSLGVVAMADSIAPKAVDSATKIVAKTFILPHLESIEKGIRTVCHIKECQPDEKIPPEKRAEDLARAVVLFTPAWLISMAAKVGTRRLMNKHYGIHDPGIRPSESGKKQPFWYMTPIERRIFLADEGVHYGSLIYFNTRGADYTHDLIQATSKMLQDQTGMSERKAHDIASMTMIWELPNLLGLGAGLGVIYGKHKYGWGDQRKPNPPHR